MRARADFVLIGVFAVIANRCVRTQKVSEVCAVASRPSSLIVICCTACRICPSGEMAA